MKRRSLFYALASLCLLLLALTGRSAAQSSTVSLQEYQERIRESHAAAQRNDLPGLRSAVERLQAIEQVELGQDQHVAVDNSWLAEAIATARPPMEEIAGYLGTLLEVLIAAREDDPQALQKLQEILSRPPFAPSEPSWLARMLERFGDFLGDLFDPITGGAGFVNIGEALVTLIAVAALIFGIVYITRLIRGALVREARVKTTEADEEEPETSGEAVSRAEDLAAGGDYRSAVRYLYLSTLLWLHERRLLQYDRALTNHEVLRTVPAESPIHAHLRPVVQTFDRVWYGHHPLDEAAFDQFRRQVASLREGQP